MNLLRPLTIGLLVLLPLSTLAAPMKGVIKPPRLDYYTKFSRASSAKSSASSSTPYLNTIRSKELEAIFKMPEDWKADYRPNLVVFSKNNLAFTPYNTSYIGVEREAITKDQSITLMYNNFLHDATIETHNYDPYGVDFYMPSFNLTSHSTIKVIGKDALSIAFTGERASTEWSFRRVYFIKDKWKYTIYSNSLPQYAEADGKVFDGVVGSFSLSDTANSSSAKSVASSSVKRR